MLLMNLVTSVLPENQPEFYPSYVSVVPITHQNLFVVCNCLNNIIISLFIKVLINNCHLVKYLQHFNHALTKKKKCLQILNFSSRDSVLQQLCSSIFATTALILLSLFYPTDQNFSRTCTSSYLLCIVTSHFVGSLNHVEGESVSSCLFWSSSGFFVHIGHITLL